MSRHGKGQEGTQAPRPLVRPLYEGTSSPATTEHLTSPSLTLATPELEEPPQTTALTDLRQTQRIKKLIGSLSCSFKLQHRSQEQI